MQIKVLKALSLMGAVVLGAGGSLAQAQAGAAITEAKVKELLTAGTGITACGDGQYTFETVQIGARIKQKVGDKSFDFFPVHARFAVVCRYGDEKMRAEVDLTTAYYKDPFGAWQPSGPDFSGDQSWDNTQSDVRCRVQNLAHLTVDKDDKVTGSTPAKDQGYIGCTARSKASD